MKKIIAILLSVVLLTAFSVNVTAAGIQVSCDVSSETIKNGEQVTLNFSLSGAEYAQAALIEISYQSGFTIVSGQWLKGSAIITDFNGEDGVIAFDKETSFNGSLFKLVLKAKEDAGGKHDIKATITLKNGSVDVGSASVTKAVTIGTTTSKPTSSSEASSNAGNKTSTASSKSNSTKVSTVSKADSTTSTTKETVGSNSETDLTESSAPSVVTPPTESGAAQVDSAAENTQNSSNPVWWIIIIIGAVAVGVIAFVVSKSKRH